MNSSRSTYLLMAICAYYAFFLSDRSVAADALCSETVNVRKSEKTKRRLPSCPVSVCFGIDGGRLTRTQVRLQRNFFRDLLKSLSRRKHVKVAAVEFGAANRRLFKLTSDLAEAIEIASNIPFRGDELASVSSSIVYCDSILRHEEKRSVRMVLFSDGTNTLGGSPGRRAEVFRTRAEGDIIAISLTDSDNKILKEVTAKNTRNIFVLDSDEYDPLLRKVTDRLCDV
ncbi:hypothetical protein BWQ96_08592 [Gracilariopsis chorda]|uniref:VWFA domain-containing protein n=1 Tax=Gracilariopsis chorda TaxID=448386 RepID=A0A2V3ICC1_9FLOR|nr:hypothetical protein BWQ96_10554 [Gracilariopsis chorda]PXF41671.1 hypothetical protein BWQ96_08592 [Gracilariopsis chorda]|eukprot:PXF39745.1 hypothetical protein BWQ96_10554 [Gracilariopsis chorda]